MICVLAGIVSGPDEVRLTSGSGPAQVRTNPVFGRFWAGHHTELVRS